MCGYQDPQGPSNRALMALNSGYLGYNRGLLGGKVGFKALGSGFRRNVYRV